MFREEWPAAACIPRQAAGDRIVYPLRSNYAIAMPGRLANLGPAFFPVGPDPIHVSERWENMDRQTKREIWLLTIGTIIVEIPVAFAAFTILSH
jgi:hypothetical protein